MPEEEFFFTSALKEESVHVKKKKIERKHWYKGKFLSP